MMNRIIGSALNVVGLVSVFGLTTYLFFVFGLGCSIFANLALFSVWSGFIGKKSKLGAVKGAICGLLGGVVGFALVSSYYRNEANYLRENSH
jgi:hypothetical protein